MIWLKASYNFHTYCYRDPRSVYSTGVGIPVVSPTTVYLGILSTLFRLGRENEAHDFISNIDRFTVIVDAPDAIIFFRAFHQVRRYHSRKWGANPRMGLTQINQATKEYGLTQGEMTIYVQVDEKFKESVHSALENLTHLGTKDSLCSLCKNIEVVNQPVDIIYKPSIMISNEDAIKHLRSRKSLTMVTLSRFVENPNPIIYNWFMSGNQNTLLETYVIPGRYIGTTKGKIYMKE